MTVDWERLRESLKRSQEALEKALVPAEERMEEIRRERAARLAARDKEDTGRGREIPLLIVSVASEQYGIELDRMREVRPLTGYTAVPGSPPAFLGVLSLRGRIHPVVDLARLLELPPGKELRASDVILLKTKAAEVGARVDQCEGILWVREGDLTPPEKVALAAPAGHLKSLARGSLPVLNVESLLSQLFERRDLGHGNNGR